MTPTLEKPGPPAVKPSRILDLSWGIARTGTLTAALDLDVFTHIAAGATTARTIAERCDSDVAATTTLLTCLAGLELLEVATGGPEPSYELAADSEAFLVRGRPRYLGDMRHMHHELNFRLWPRLAETVVAGGPDHDLFADDGSEVWTRVAPYLDQLAEAGAAWLTRALGDSLPTDARVLDLGCGSGAYGRVLARSSPEVRVTAVDRPEVVARAMKLAEESGLDDRIDGRAGDLRSIDWGGPYDLVVLSNLLHGYDEPDAIALLRRVASVLAPGGRVAILEFVVDPERPLDNPVAAFFSLQLLMTSGGKGYRLAEYEQQLRDAGLRMQDATRNPASPSTLILAELAAR